MSKFVVSRRYWLVMGAVLNCCAITAAQDRQPTLISVSLPADARLEINGRPTSATGTTREFRDSQSQSSGGVYRYLLRASIERNGRHIVQDRLLRLQAGDTEQVTFQFAQPVVARKELAVPPENAMAQAADFQPRFQPRTSDSNQLPDLPPVGDTTDDALPPLTTQPELPSLDEPATGGSRFGRQFGEEPDQPVPADNELPPIDEPEVSEPRLDTPPTTTTPQPEAAKSLIEKPAVDPAGGTSPRPIAYLGHDHMHQFIDDTGTALHVWQFRWRMVRLERSGVNGAYSIYKEIDHPGYNWAYGRLSTCGGQVPVFFKPGRGAPWQFIGDAKRVRPFSN